jgi:tRNA nucleotidyltransferase (CCA-adding enzyme)
MRIILTHEQADFDALASLLAAHLLDENNLPVLPARLNRNLRSFLTLYGVELPFVEARDARAANGERGERLEHVTLVDTQSLVTLKGMSSKTAVSVIDHHERRTDLPQGWNFHNERTGACTTILVEMLREAGNGILSVIQATLLLLGIYEDTGSLTYASTTPRDALAAAYLLEHGASLKIAAQFLNPPLSPEQRIACDRLLAAVETHTIHGQSIVIACAALEEMTEEISAVAHKLRDLLDPHALFLLVGTLEGVRLVARSTSDQVNVSRVAARFGGGGHERAAAALIRREEGQTLEQVRARLLALLPEVVQPSLTMRKIMSRRPRLLEPDTPAEEAARLMQRYGYEGYPVVRAGKLIGLLTRRAVDRAISHKLNLSAASLMDAGEVFVHPEDPVEQLQKVMTQSGWGQVPVVDADNGKIIGIVTRTDLLRALAGREGPTGQSLPGAVNLSARLEAALPPGHVALLRLVAAEARALRRGAYIVGGFVRDLILERPSLDFDIVIEGDAIGLARALAHRFGGRLVSHSRFGTAKWRLNEQEGGQPGLDARLVQALGGAGGLPDFLDLISARTEFYEYPSALPTVERSSIKLDLHRRDFTINTLALRLDGRHYGDLYDFWGGLSDLRHGLVRVLHSLSFVDDPTRMARAVRFEQRFGFAIEDRTRQLIVEARDLLRQLSGDRLRHELDLILAEKRAPAMLARLEELGLLSTLHAELGWKAELAGALEEVLRGGLDASWKLPETWQHAPLRRVLAYCIWLSPLSAESAAQLAQRLRLPLPVAQAVEATCRLAKTGLGVAGEKPSRAAAILAEIPLPAAYALRVLGLPPRARVALQSYITTWRHIQPITDGDALLARGLKPGPLFARVLSALRDAWLDGQIHTLAEEHALLEDLLSQ